MSNNVARVHVNAMAPEKRKRRSRWGDESEKVEIAGLPTQLSANLSGDQLRQYVRVMRVEEITVLLRQDDLKAPRNRSPSPESTVYGAGMEGKINTRDIRYRNKLEEERHRLVNEAMREDPTYRPPIEYRRPGGKSEEKVYIPATEFPEVNFIGLLIGPRGNTLKKMEADTGAKISIRGKGSVKEGKGLRNGHPQPSEQDELHALVMGDSEEKVVAGVKLINTIIEEACSQPEGQNDLKRHQLRELALLNGTLRDDDGQACGNCGSSDHRRFECPQRTNITNTTFCRICGGVGHTASDCKERNNPEALRQAAERNQVTDSDYIRLMRELDNGNSADGANLNAAPTITSSAPWHQSAAANPQQIYQQPIQIIPQDQLPQQWPPVDGQGGYYQDPAAMGDYLMDPAMAYPPAQNAYDPYAAAAWASQQWAAQQAANEGQ